MFMLRFYLLKYKNKNKNNKIVEDEIKQAYTEFDRFKFTNMHRRSHSKLKNKKKSIGDKKNLVIKKFYYDIW